MPPDRHFAPRSPRRPGPAILGLGAIVVGVGALLIFFDRHQGSRPAAVRAKSPGIVSLVPAATDILESMGCGDHLLAVLNVDQNPAAAGLPRVGDYQTTDWEAIGALRPDWIVTHFGAGRTPAGFVQHADSLRARQLNLQTGTLDGADSKLTIYYAIGALGKACNEPEKAARAEAQLRARLAAVRTRVAGRTPAQALIVIGAEGTMVAGRESYLSEVLGIAGGVNVAAKLSARYPQIDREQLLALQPQVILQLLPNASKQVREQAESFWTSFPDLPAVRNHRVKQFTSWYVLLPGYHVGQLAEEFAEAIHLQPEPSR